MKLNIKLGVPTEALLKHPTACFNLSKAATRVSAALSFGEFYLKQSKGVVTPRELEHMSASIWSSSKSAEDLAKFIDDPELRKAVDDYAVAGRRFNNELRKNLPSIQKLKTSITKDKTASKPLTVAQMTARTAALRSKLADIEKKVESLCTVDKLAPAPVMKGRVGMGGSGITPRKRPMYPRYFVAAMGRSRR